MLVRLSALAFVGIFCLARPVFAQEPPKTPLESLMVYPSQIHFDGPRAEQRLGVLALYGGGQQWDMTRQAKFASSDPKVAVIDDGGVVRPVGNGQAIITVTAAGKNRTLPIQVKNATADEPMDFAREIVPILTRAGCNQGACHGSQHGKGGFKLSLLGFNPAFDFPQIVQSAEGRRVVVADPERSILLQKPALLMEHRGGERFKVGSRSYRYLQRWLEDGVPGPTGREPEVARIEVWPAKRLMVPGEEQQIFVQAIYPDGRIEDVTATAQFDSLNDAVAQVSPTGLVTTKARGETHVMVRYRGQATVMRMTSPYTRLEPYPDLPRNNFIDDHLIAKWKDLGLTPSSLCQEEDFLRRVHLDAIGTLPTPEEVRKYLADPAPGKRARAIDQALDRPEFIDYWTLKWGDLLKINRDTLNDRGMWSFHNWIRACLRDKKPIDEMVREIITAEGSTFTEGPANYYMTSRGPADWAETTSQLFLGVRMGCAKCHHHPFEKWSQADYNGMTNFFTGLGTKRSQEFGLFGGEQVIYLKSSGGPKPRPLDGEVMDHPMDRRIKLAEWLTQPNNPFFARNLVNRFWGYVMGRGLVEPLDDLRATNPASNPELLDALAADFVANKYDLRHLVRTIMNSRAYQLSSKATPGNSPDAANVHYTRFTLRRLSAEPLADALDYATGTQEKYQGLPLGTRAIQLPDSGVRSFFLEVFGKPARQITCECERTTQPNIAQALHLLNGDFLNKKIANDKGRLENLLKAKKDLPSIIDEIYLVTLSRPPQPEEIQRALGWIKTAPTPREGLQDLMWVLLNSREFLFNR